MGKRFSFSFVKFTRRGAPLRYLPKGLTVLTAGAILLATPLTAADRFDQQINSLQAQNAQSAAASAGLQETAASLAATVADLQAKIATLEATIQQTQAKHDALVANIAQNEAKLAKQRATLGSNIKEMYMEGQMSTFEKLVTSKDLSAYVDKEQATAVVQNKINKTVETIKKLQIELQKQRELVEKLLNDQKEMQAQLDKERATAANLLALNESQQAEYNNNISANNSKIASLRRQQAIENARNFVGGISYSGSGGYPWAGAPFPNALVDPWGMYQRQCVSYAAWKVASTGRHMPYWGGRGNANQWDDNARAAGIPVDAAPRVGDIAVSNAGAYGHVMFVEAVYGDGTIYISQYNGAWDGKYSEGKRTTAGLVFIHF